MNSQPSNPPFMRPAATSSWEWPSTFTHYPSPQELWGWLKVHRGLNLLFWGNLIALIVIVFVSVATATMTTEELVAAAGGTAAVLGSLVMIGAFVAVVIGQMLCLSVPVTGRLRATIVAALGCLLAAVFVALLASMLMDPRLIGVAQLLAVANLVLIVSFLAGLGMLWGRPKLVHNARGVLVALVVLVVATIVVNLLLAQRLGIEQLGLEGVVVERQVDGQLAVAPLVFALLWLALHVWYLVVLQQARRTVDIRRLPPPAKITGAAPGAATPPQQQPPPAAPPSGTV